jgi:ribosomal protein L37E
MHAYGEAWLAIFVVLIVAPIAIGSLLSCLVLAIRQVRNRRAYQRAAVCPACGASLAGVRGSICAACGVPVVRVIRESRWHGLICTLIATVKFVISFSAFLVGIFFVLGTTLDVGKEAAFSIGLTLASALALTCAIQTYLNLRWKYTSIRLARCRECRRALVDPRVGCCLRCQTAPESGDRARTDRATQIDDVCWKRLHIGMRRADVAECLGRPGEQRSRGPCTIWYYPDEQGYEVVFEKGRLMSKRGPIGEKV